MTEFTFSTFSSIFKKICWHTVIIFLWRNLFIILKPWNIINPLMHQSFDYTLWQRSTKYATSSLVPTLWKNLSANFCHVIMVMNCFCRMVDLRTAGSRVSRRDHLQEASPSWISNTKGWESILDCRNSNP